MASVMSPERSDELPLLPDDEADDFVSVLWSSSKSKSGRSPPASDGDLSLRMRFFLANKTDPGILVLCVLQDRTNAACGGGPERVNAFDDGTCCSPNESSSKKGSDRTENTWYDMMTMLGGGIEWMERAVSMQDSNSNNSVYCFSLDAFLSWSMMGDGQVADFSDWIYLLTQLSV